MKIIDNIRAAFSPKFLDKLIDTGLKEVPVSKSEQKVAPLDAPRLYATAPPIQKVAPLLLEVDTLVQQLYDSGVTLDQIREEYTRIDRKSWIYANWEVQLITRCPGCSEQVDLMSYPDFWDGRAICVGETGTKNTTQMDVTCPECLREFQVTCA